MGPLLISAGAGGAIIGVVLVLLLVWRPDLVSTKAFLHHSTPISQILNQYPKFLKFHEDKESERGATLTEGNATSIVEPSMGRSQLFSRENPPFLSNEARNILDRVYREAEKISARRKAAIRTTDESLDNGPPERGLRNPREPSEPTIDVKLGTRLANHSLK